MSTPPTPLIDHAAPILAGDPVLSDANRADLWDIFHGSKDPAELEQHIQRLAFPTEGQQPLVVPDDTKKRLISAKQQSMPVTGPVDKITSVMNQMTQMDPKALEVAEAHPTVFKTLTAAVAPPEKGAQDGSGATSGDSKGKKAADDGSATPLALPPRADGLEHLPPIPDKHRRVLASDGGIHDIPDENVPKAFELDPRLHVMNP